MSELSRSTICPFRFSQKNLSVPVIHWAGQVIEMSSAAATRQRATDGVAPTLTANGKVLDRSPARLGRLTPTEADAPAGEMQEQFRAQGYLWLKHFLNPWTVTAYRGQIFAALSEAGLIKAGSDPRLGLASSIAPNKHAAEQKLMMLVRSAAFEGFCAQPRLIAFMDQFLGGLSHLHKRKILRYTLPNTPVATPAHYDLVYLRGGTNRIVTAWIPIGDVPVEMGGLVYLEGSHAIGAKMEVEFTAKAGTLTPEERIDAYNKNMSEGGWVSKDLPDMAERFNTRWLIADYEAGDVVLHSPYMIHASTNNEDAAGRIRLSTDIRYQRVEDAIDARWGNHWSYSDKL
jgi:ectoine hydroxylase-related dioxygenase (phytanoyl-CoA dioxygenase family)